MFYLGLNFLYRNSQNPKKREEPWKPLDFLWNSMKKLWEPKSQISTCNDASCISRFALVSCLTSWAENSRWYNHTLAISQKFRISDRLVVTSNHTYRFKTTGHDIDTREGDLCLQPCPEILALPLPCCCLVNSLSAQTCYPETIREKESEEFLCLSGSAIYNIDINNGSVPLLIARFSPSKDINSGFLVNNTRHSSWITQRWADGLEEKRVARRRRLRKLACASAWRRRLVLSLYSWRSNPKFLTREHFINPS